MQSDLRLILEVVGGIVLLVTVVWSISTFIDKRIEKKIQDEKFIKKLAAATRPALIIDGENSIVHDHGALDLLESITVHRGSTEGFPEKIVVVPFPPQRRLAVSTPSRHTATNPNVGQCHTRELTPTCPRLTTS